MSPAWAVPDFTYRALLGSLKHVCVPSFLPAYSSECAAFLCRADPDKLQKRLQAVAQEEAPRRRKGRWGQRAEEVLLRAMSMPTSAALKLVGDQHVGQILEHQQLSMGGPVPSSQVLHFRPELGGDEVTSPSSSSPGIYLGRLKTPFLPHALLP